MEGREMHAVPLAWEPRWETASPTLPESVEEHPGH